MSCAMIWQNSISGLYTSLNKAFKWYSIKYLSLAYLPFHTQDADREMEINFEAHL